MNELISEVIRLRHQADIELSTADAIALMQAEATRDQVDVMVDQVEIMRLVFSVINGGITK